MKRQIPSQYKISTLSIFHRLCSARYALAVVWVLVLFIVSACNTEEGALPTGEEPEYPEFSFSKVGEIEINIDALWTEIDFSQYHYEGDQPLMFIRIKQNIVALDMDREKVRWVLPESAFGIEARQESRISVFDKEGKLLITTGEIWKVVDPETGSVDQTFDIIEYSIIESIPVGYNYVNGTAYVYTLNRDFDKTYIYQLNFSMAEAELLKTFQRPSIYQIDYPVLFPYDESEDKLLLTFPILEDSENPGAYFPYMHPKNLEIDSHYLDSETFERSQMSIDEQIAYHDGILSFGTSGGKFFSYSLEDSELTFFNRNLLDRLRTVERGYILIWKNNYVNVYENKTGKRILSSSRYPSDVVTPPLIHPSEDIVIIPYRDRILMVELYTEKLLVEHPIAEADTPYEAIFFDTQGRLCVLGRDQRLEFFELPI